MSDRRIEDIIKYRNEWQRENLERIAFTVPKGQRAKIREHAKSRGYTSVNKYLLNLIKKDMNE